MTKPTDKEILDSVQGGMAIRDMGSMTFLHWLTGKLNGVKAYSAANQELIGLIRTPPLSRTMPDGEKCKIVRKLLEMEIEVNL